MPKASEPDQQQPPTNQEEAPDPNEPPQRQSERQPPVLPAILQRPPAWFEGEQDGRRFYFHEPSGASQWNPPNEPYVPFTPTTTAAPLTHQAPQTPNDETNGTMPQQTALRERPGNVRSL